MKKLIFLGMLLVWCTGAFSQVIQVKEVPAVVVTSFQTTNPSVNVVQWKKVGTYYEADYKQDNNDMYVTYDPSGKLIESGQGVEISTVPASVNTYVKTKYKDDKMVKYYKVKDANGKTLWRGKVKSDYILFDENGNYIKMEKD